MSWTRFEWRFWKQVCRTQRQADRIAFAAAMLFMAVAGCGITVAAAWLLSLE